MDMSDPSMAMKMFSGMGMASSGVSAFAQYKQGQAQRSAYDYNANVILENMREQASSSELKFESLMGRQRSLYAKAGVDITSGSPLLILADTAMQASEETGRITESGESQAALQRFYGRMAETSSTTGAFSTFLTGLGKSGFQYMMGQKGVNSPYV
jgi:hypothetical protein